jgi:glycosyltransferase involved in cell wall biosynthesis
MISLTRRGKQEHVNLKIIPENKIVPIYSCIDINRYKPNQPRLEHFYETLNIPKNGFIFGSITRLTPIKGNRYLIDAFAELYKEFPCAYLVLIGDGEEKQKLKNQIDILRLNDNIKLLGWRNDTVELLGFINVFVLASLNEGMGRAVLEAMACGKPVIATKVGGIPELVIHDQTGMLVAPANSDELSTAMRQLLTDREKMKKFSRAGMNRISKQFSLEKMIQDIDQLYGELLKENT